MIAVLDTNILFDDWQFRSVPLRVLLECGPKISLQVAVPAVVVDELIAKFTESYREAVDRATVALRHLRHLTANPYGVKPRLRWSDFETQGYSSRLREFVGSHGIQILPYPSVDHGAVVARLHNKKKPFSGDERGYRDFLIWRTLVELATAGNSCTFVTRNTRDFAAGDGLHPDLQRDLPRDAVTVSLAPSVRDLLRSEVFPRLAPKAGLRAKLETNELKMFTPREWISGYVVAQPDLFGGVDWRMPHDLEQPDHVEFIEVETWRVLDVYDFKPDGSLVEVEVEMAVELTIGVHPADAEWVGAGWDREWGDEHVVVLVKSVVITCSAELVIDPESGEILDGSVSPPRQVSAAR